eukprot:3962999-Alexandrium_andersonii.AAC.1
MARTSSTSPLLRRRSPPHRRSSRPSGLLSRRRASASTSPRARPRLCFGSLARDPRSTPFGSSGTHGLSCRAHRVASGCTLH